MNQSTRWARERKTYDLVFCRVQWPPCLELTNHVVKLGDASLGINISLPCYRNSGGEVKKESEKLRGYLRIQWWCRSTKGDCVSGIWRFSISLCLHARCGGFYKTQLLSAKDLSFTISVNFIFYVESTSYTKLIILHFANIVCWGKVQTHISSWIYMMMSY